MSQQIQIQRILPRHYRIIELAAANHDAKVIAEALEMPIRSVKMLLKDPLVQSEIARKKSMDDTVEVMGMDRNAAMGKARSILEQASIAAADKHVELMSDPDSSIQLRSAQSILKNVFGDNKTGTQQVFNITAENVSLLNLALKESENVRKHELVSSADKAPANGAIDRQGDVCQES